MPICLEKAQRQIIGQDISISPNDRLEDEPVDRAPHIFQQHDAVQDIPEQVHDGILDQPATIQELYGLWITQTARTDQGVQAPLVIATWYLDLHRHEVCEQHREVTLSRDLAQWTQQIFETWQDLIDLAWPLNLHLVRPQPPVTRGRDREAIHIIVVQRSLPDRMANLFNIVDPGLREGYRDVVTFAPAQISKDDVITAVNYAHRCFPERSHLQCMTWHGDFEIRGRIAIRNRHGLSFLMIFNEVFEPATSSTTPFWDFEENDAAQFLQIHSQRRNRIQLELDKLLPATTAVNILSSRGPGVLPSPLEIALPGTAEQVEQELLCWGHRCKAFTCEPYNAFLCIHEEHVAAGDQRHFLFCHDDNGDMEGCFLHSAAHDLSHGQLMSFLCSIGYPRAVIVAVIQLEGTWSKVLFHHSEPEVETTTKPDREPTAWPGRLGHQRTVRQLTDVEAFDTLNAKCSLTTSFNKTDLAELFQSGLDVLCTDFDVIELAPEIRDELNQLQIKPLQSLKDLDEFDRLLIFTDGSSRPSMRRIVPERADEMGYPDSWAMVVVGESFSKEDTKGACLTVLGWTSHPVRYDPQGCAFMGIQRIGSDMAERAALIGAAVWRLSLNHAIPTIIRTDSLLGAGQANGSTGVTQPDDSYYLLRALYQALELALPVGDFLIQHVRAHAGDLFNEIADTAAQQVLQFAEAELESL